MRTFTIIAEIAFRNKSPMPASSSFCLVRSFKVAKRKWISGLLFTTVTASNHRHTSSISFTFFLTHRPHYHVSPTKWWPQNCSYCLCFCCYTSPGWPKFAWTQLMSCRRQNRHPTNHASKNSHVSFLTVPCTQDTFVFSLDSAVSHFSRYRYSTNVSPTKAPMTKKSVSLLGE